MSLNSGLSYEARDFLNTLENNESMHRDLSLMIFDLLFSDFHKNGILKNR